MAHPVKKGEKFHTPWSDEIMTVRQFFAETAEGEAFFSDTYEGAIKKNAKSVTIINEEYGGMTELSTSIKL